MHDGHDDQLSNARAPHDRKRFVAKIHKNNLYFAAVVGIDGAGCVQHRDAMPRGKPGAWPHLTFHAAR